MPRIAGEGRAPAEVELRLRIRFEHIDRDGEAGDGRHGIVEACPWRGAFAHHHAGNVEIALRQYVQRGQCMADGAEIAARNQQHRDAQRGHPVEHGVGLIERHHDPADALDQGHAAAVSGIACELDQGAEIEGAAFRLGGEVGRQGRREAPGRDAVDLIRRCGAVEGGKQDAGVAIGGVGWIEAADDRLIGVDGFAGTSQVPHQRGGDEGLSDVGARAGDEDTGHGSALQDA